MQKRAVILLFFFLHLCLYGKALGNRIRISNDNFILNNRVFEGAEENVFNFFKSRKEAKAYKRKHGIRGKIRKQKDGTFAIETEATTIQFDQKMADIVANGIGNNGIVFAVLVKAPPLKNRTTLLLETEKIPPLTFWQKLNGGIVG